MFYSHSGAVIVSTPQDVALLDARKGVHMFNKVGVSVGVNSLEIYPQAILDAP